MRIRMKKGKVSLLLFWLTICFASVIQAQIWDLADDFTPFSGGTNPNGQWSYGYLSEVDGSYISLDVWDPTVHGLSGSNVGGWHGAGGWDTQGNVWKNFGPNPIEDWTSYREAGMRRQKRAEKYC